MSDPRDQLPTPNLDILNAIMWTLLVAIAVVVLVIYVPAFVSMAHH